ncbi:phosphonate metabolism protein PhnP [Enterobacterales bacterium CwR94]|nr:phosphonate metabolism protein PhnP [Enterobacterales bacterium CwR94]
MNMTFLGTGDVRQVPVFGCDCAACLRARQNPARRRAATSALIEVEGEKTLIDAGLAHLEHRFQPGELSRILVTHYHMDHVAGLFSLRWGLGPSIPVYSPPDTQGCDDLYRHPGMLQFQPFLIPFEPVQFGRLTVTPIPLQHSKLTFGYLLEVGHRRLAYLTDTVGLPPDSEAYLRQFHLHGLVLDCSHPPQVDEPRNHNDVTHALAIRDALHPDQLWLTHLSHEMDNWLMHNVLPAGISAAFDGQSIAI